MVIWKFRIEPKNNEFYIPKDSIVLDVQVQHGKPTIWFLVDPDNAIELRRFYVYGTGWFIENDPGVYIGTFQLNDGALVFHVFEDIT